MHIERMKVHVDSILILCCEYTLRNVLFSALLSIGYVSAGRLGFRDHVTDNPYNKIRYYSVFTPLNALFARTLLQLLLLICVKNDSWESLLARFSCVLSAACSPPPTS